MSKPNKIFNYSFILILFVLFTACAPAKKNTYYDKKKKTSHVNESQLGRNKYYFSSGYQKKLTKTFKKK